MAQVTERLTGAAGDGSRKQGTDITADLGDLAQIEGEAGDLGLPPRNDEPART